MAAVLDEAMGAATWMAGHIAVAAHLIFHQSGAVGLRPLILFFRTAGLAPFLACSFGAQFRLANDLQSLVLDYGQQQQQRLGPAMPPRKISLCEDETYLFSFPCLVAIEPLCGAPHKGSCVA